MPDDFGRLRLLLLDTQPDGTPDGSWPRLRAAVPRPHENFRAPYDVRSGPLPANADGVRGTAWFVPPAHRRAHWLEVAQTLRGQWVVAEATIRRFRQPGAGGAPPAGAELTERAADGASLDLAMLTPMAAAAGRRRI